MVALSRRDNTRGGRWKQRSGVIRLCIMLFKGAEDLSPGCGMYEEIFLEASYETRPSRSPRHAVSKLHVRVNISSPQRATCLVPHPVPGRVNMQCQLHTRKNCSLHTATCVSDSCLHEFYSCLYPCLPLSSTQPFTSHWLSSHYHTRH